MRPTSKRHHRGTFVSMAVATDMAGLTEGRIEELAMAGRIKTDTIRGKCFYSLEDCEAEAKKGGFTEGGDPVDLRRQKSEPGRSGIRPGSKSPPLLGER